MNPQAWQVLTWALGGLLTIALFALNRLLGKIDAKDAEIKAKDETILNLRLSVIELKGIGRVVDRTLSALPAASSEGSPP